MSAEPTRVEAKIPGAIYIDIGFRIDTFAAALMFLWMLGKHWGLW